MVRTRVRTCVIHFAASLIFVLAGGHAVAASAVFVQGISDGKGANAAYASADANLRSKVLSGQDFTSNNYGAQDQLTIGHEPEEYVRALIRFDLTSLAGRVQAVHSARLTLTVAHTDVAGFPAVLPSPLTILLSRLAPANGGWQEGTSSTGATQAGTASWAWRATGTNAWAGAPGCGLAGVDYVSAPAASAARTEGFWSPGETWTFALDPATIQLWIDSPTSNTGWLLHSSDLETSGTNTFLSTISFWSDDAADPTTRPRLEIDYDPLPPVGSQPEMRSEALGNDPANPRLIPIMATSLSSGNPDGSFGGSGLVQVGIDPNTPSDQIWRSLFHFDLSPLHGIAAQVTAAEFCLTNQGQSVSGNPLPTGAQSLDLFAVQPANALWRQGMQTSGAVEAAAATWNWLAYNTSHWAGGNPAGAGIGSAGVDFDPMPLASLTQPLANLTPGAKLNWRILDTALIQNWIDHPELNAGIKLQSQSLESFGAAHNSVRARLAFYSDDATTMTLRPALILTYWVANAQASQSAASSVWLQAR